MEGNSIQITNRGREERLADRPSFERVMEELSKVAIEAVGEAALEAHGLPPEADGYSSEETPTQSLETEESQVKNSSAEPVDYKLTEQPVMPLLPQKDLRYKLEQARNEKKGQRLYDIDISTAEGLTLFINEASKAPLLEADEEIDLAKRIERGDLVAKERLITSNVRLVVSVARGFQNLGLPLEDVIQDGMIGLIRASELFDWRKGFKFSTYSTLWIRQSIQRGLANTGNTIRIPVHVGQKVRKSQRVFGELTAELGREPAPDEVAERLGLTLEEYADLEHAGNLNVVSLDEPASEDSETSRGELIPAEGSAEDEATEDMASDALTKALSTLHERDQEIIKLRFGLDGYAEHSLRDTAEQVGVSPERARQIENRVLKYLQDREDVRALRDAA
jgi:RNA polymerase primary sigma factor